MQCVMLAAGAGGVPARSDQSLWQAQGSDGKHCLDVSNLSSVRAEMVMRACARCRKGRVRACGAHRGRGLVLSMMRSGCSVDSSRTRSGAGRFCRLVVQERYLERPVLSCLPGLSVWQQRLCLECRQVTSRAHVEQGTWRPRNRSHA